MPNAICTTAALPTFEFGPPALRSNWPRLPYSPFIFSVYYLFKNQKTLYKTRKYRQDLRSPKTVENKKPHISIRISFSSRFPLLDLSRPRLSSLFSSRVVYDYSQWCPPWPAPLAASSFLLRRSPWASPLTRLSLLVDPPSSPIHPLLFTAAIPSSSISRVSVLLPILFPLRSPAGPPLQSASASPPTSIVPAIPGPILNSAPIYPCSHIPLFTYAYAS